MAKEWNIRWCNFTNTQQEIDQSLSMLKIKTKKDENNVKKYVSLSVVFWKLRT